LVIPSQIHVIMAL